MPVLSSSVNDARKTASADPRCSTSLRAVVGPRPGVSEMARHQHDIVEAVSGDLRDNDVQKDFIVADIHQRLGCRAGEGAKARAFAADENAGLADRL